MRRLYPLLLLFAALYLYRTGPEVWSYVIRTPGDFGYNYQAAAALLRGESPFRPDFAYPGIVPLLLAPLARLPIEPARIVWYLLSQAALIGAALCLFRPLGGDGAALIALGALWSAAGTVPENLALGQMNPILLLLIALAMRWILSAPGRAGAALGAAAALKVWPGVLLLPFVRRERRRGLALGLAIAAFSVVLPWAVYRAFLPPPYSPVAAKYWMGTPAPLNFSLPAAVLRVSYRGSASGEPRDWVVGNNPAVLRLAAWRRDLSAAVSLALLAAGLAAWRLRVSRTAARGMASPRDDLTALAYLTVLCVVASPISWYHYQLLLLPAGALLVAGSLRRRVPWALAGQAALVLAATWANRLPSLGPLLGLSTERCVAVAGLVVPVLDLVVLALLLGGIGRERSGEPICGVSPTAAAPRTSSRTPG
jgi:alpha-1,2-mannosyltransferase